MGQTAPESDSDSGMGSPSEELLKETTATKEEELQGEETSRNTEMNTLEAFAFFYHLFF